LNGIALKDGKPEPNGERAPKPPAPGAMLWLRYGLKHPERFLERVAKQALVEPKPKNSDEPEKGEVDSGTENSLALCREILAGFSAKQAEEDAELARVVKIVRRTVTADRSGGWGKSNQPQSADLTVIQPRPMRRYFGAQFSTAGIEQSCLM
jgi:hypothetical protein